MKYLLIFSVMLLSIMRGYAQSDNITGIWLTEDGKSQVRIYKATNGKYYGKIVWIMEKDKRDNLDVKNPDEKLRDRKILGLTIILGLEYNPDEKEWSKGYAYDPESGKSYDCFIRFEAGDNNTLYLKGFLMGMRFVGRTTVWQREEAVRTE